MGVLRLEQTPAPSLRASALLLLDAPRKNAEIEAEVSCNV